MEIRNFSWVMPGKLAGCAMPGSGENSTCDDIRLLSEKGIRVLISLEFPKDDVADCCSRYGMEWLLFEIPDFNIPTDKEAFTGLVHTCTNAIITEQPVCVHCRAGIGRTGLLLSCILGAYLKLPADKALSAVRQSRSAVENDKQYAFISTFLSDYEI